MGTHQSGAALDCLGYNLRSVDLAEAEAATETGTGTETAAKAEPALSCPTLSATGSS